MTRVSKLILMATMIGGMVGCVSPPPPMDVESAAHHLMKSMLRSPQFDTNCKVVKASTGRSPIVVIGKIENKTSERIQGRLDTVGDVIRAVLFDSERCEVKDDAAADAIKSRIIRGADGGLENGALVQTMGTQDSPDFIVLGDMRHFSDAGGCRTYCLRLAIHNLSTGKVVWEGIQTKIGL